MINFFGNEEIEIDNSWDKFLTSNIKAELQEIEDSIGNNFTPSVDKALRFLSIDLNEIKYIVLGKDPYPQKSVATGRAFEVSNVETWQDTSINASLKNILKLIHNINMGISKLNQLLM